MRSDSIVPAMMASYMFENKQIRNCTIFGAQRDLGRPFDFSTFDLGVTSRDLSMTLTVLQKNLRKWTLAPKLLGLEWCNLGKS